jgi:O-antigen/teichoic acid export membrane protein
MANSNWRATFGLPFSPLRLPAPATGDCSKIPGLAARIPLPAILTDSIRCWDDPPPFVLSRNIRTSYMPAARRLKLAAEPPSPEAFSKEAMRRGVKTVLTGQGAAYAITFGTLPLLAMLYTPYDFAALGVFSAIAIVAGPACTLCYPNTIPLADDDNTAVNALGASLTLSLLAAMAVGMAFYLAPASLLEAIRIEWMGSYVPLLAATVGCIGWQQTFTCWCVRRQAYHSLAQGRVFLTLVRIVTQLALGLCVTGPWGLIFGFALGNVAGAVVVILQCRGDWGLKSQIRLREMRSVVATYRHFALFGTLPEIAQRVAVQSPSVLLGITYDYQVAGWYMMTQRVFGAPQTMLQQAVSRVFMGVGARSMASNPAGLRILFCYTLRKMFVWTIAPYALFMVAAPFIFASLLDSTWAAAGIYCSLLTPMFFVRLLYDSLRPAIDLLQRPQLHTTGSLIITAALVLGIVVPYALGWSATLAIVTLSATVLAGQVVALFLMWRAVVNCRYESVSHSSNRALAA